MLRLISITLSLIILVLCLLERAFVDFLGLRERTTDYQQLANYEPPVVTRVHAGNGALLAEYASEKRLFVPVEAIPPRLIQAFISAED